MIKARHKRKLNGVTPFIFLTNAFDWVMLIQLTLIVMAERRRGEAGRRRLFYCGSQTDLKLHKNFLSPVRNAAIFRVYAR